LARLGKYELVRKLATGGMAEVFLARFEWALGLEKTVVVKRILPHLARDPAFLEMFLSEARLASLLNHPGIAQIIEFGESGGTYFLSMEHVDGLSLRALEHSFEARQETLPFAHSARIAACCCEALAHAHELVDTMTGEPLNLVHRDISPDNILISRNGAVKVVDFGIAKAASQKHRTATGHIKGKLAYMSPEQLRARELDCRADVYSLGVVLYEMLAGARPYEAPTDASLLAAILTEDMVPLRARCPEVPDVLERIVVRALQRRREDRYPNCRAMHADLEAALLDNHQSASAFQLAQLVVHDSETARFSDWRTARAQLVTPDRLQPTVKTPVPWTSEGTDSGHPASQLEPTLARTGTDDVAGEHVPTRSPGQRSGPRIAPAPVTEEEILSEGPTLQQTSPGRKAPRRAIRIALGVAVALAAVTAGAVIAAVARGPAPSPGTAGAGAPIETASAVQPPPPAPEVEPPSMVPDDPVPVAPRASPSPPPSPSPGRSAVKPAERPAAPVELALRSDPPSQLRIVAGRRVIAEGRSPLTAMVSPGTVVVEASAGGEVPFHRRETLTLGAAARQISHVITVGRGSVSVRTFPAAHVSVDGVPRGDVPLRVDLFEGQHVLRLECDRRIALCAGQPVSTRTIVVESGKTLEVEHKWQ